jgi:hypothetical protein
MPVVRSSLLQLKSGFVREVASLEGDNLVVFHYHSAQGGLWWE